MGLPMDSGLSEIHVPSGPTSSRHDPAILQGLTLRQLIERKDNLEAELRALGTVLDSHGVDMQTSLTDRDGFPRSDIDVAQVRVTRARIINLRNDWKDLMDRIEKALHEHHQNLQSSDAFKQAQATGTADSAPPVQQPQTAPERPFAKVDSVEPGSPANEAGLRVGDRISRFGTAIWSTHERLRKLSEVVQQNLGRPILVKVLRSAGERDQDLELRLTPRQGWGGRGALGCHIVVI
jgi:26S proteasome regulatory subunit N4